MFGRPSIVLILSTLPRHVFVVVVVVVVAVVAVVDVDVSVAQLYIN